HIYGENKEDVFMAFGYMQAKDRLFQMVMQNYLAAGRISEVVGAYANSSDKMHRAIGLTKSAQETYQWYLDNADTNADVKYTLEVLDAHVAGINAFIDSMTSATTPIEFKILGFTPEHWKPLDAFIWANMMSWGLSGDYTDLYRQEIRTLLNNDTMYHELFPDTMPYTVPIVSEQYDLDILEYPNAPGGYPGLAIPPPATSETDFTYDLISIEKIGILINAISDSITQLGELDVTGSNSWAVNGSKSSTGNAMLANDPHLGFQAPSLWYEVHLVVTGAESLNVQGGSLPGTPGVLIGHTETMAWGMTAVSLDVLDIFVERLNPSNDSEYWYNNEWRAFEFVDETIHTKEGIDIDYVVKWSVHGPCIDSFIDTEGFDTSPKANVAINYTGNGVTHELLSLSILNRAENLQDYYDALYWWDGAPHNFIYADIDGNIAITVAGRFPVRVGYTGEYPVEALNDSIGMVSNIPYAYLPRSVNPSTGYLSSANQLSIDPAEYDYDLLGPQAWGYRGRRIDSLLAATDDITMNDMKQWQADVFDIVAERILPAVLDAWVSEGDGNTSIQAMITELESWEYEMETDIISPTIWTYLLNAIKYETFDELRTAGLSATSGFTPVLEQLVIEENAYYFDDHSTIGEVEGMEEILVLALHRTYNEMVSELGTNMTSWMYGNHHIIYIDHLASLTYIGGGPHRGGSHTLNVARGWEVGGGPSRRMVVNFDDTPEFYSVYPGGQSQNMFGVHWDDLFDLWYTYDEDTQTYGYCQEYFFSTALAFLAADQANSNNQMIERFITFIP
ncbi:MAG: penicillin acylase family protein, partial [Candidatus Thorarchaeota archaeon]